MGKIVQNEAKLDADLVKELVSLGGNFPNFKTRSGKTVCTNDFYEGQARLDGAFCSYTESQKMEYLQWLKENGVSNIEMESTCFAALTHMGGIKSAIVCVALLDRLNEDQVSSDNLRRSKKLKTSPTPTVKIQTIGGKVYLR